MIRWRAITTNIELLEDNINNIGIDFKRAHSVGLNHITSWLPNGRREGNEWVAINPTRPDKSLGSFKINLSTGRWSDFASSQRAAGGDTVSLYAHLNRDRLMSKTEQYKNRQAGLQVEAAKEILTKYDATYRPSAKDDFTPPQPDPRDKWAGWYWVVEEYNGIAPKLDVSWYEKKWGTFVKDWNFFDNGKLIMKIVRFKIGDKKNDIPFTRWQNGSAVKWRAKSPERDYPLYNKDELTLRPNEPVLLFEGQKDAEISSKKMKNYVSVGWFGGMKSLHKTEFDPLVGRDVYFCFDADPVGRQAIPLIKKIAEKHSIRLNLVYPPTNVERGWSLADEMDKKTESELEKIIVNNKNDKSSSYLDDNPFDFKILGFSGEQITFYPFGAQKVVRHRVAGINKSILLSLMDRDKWGEFFAKNDGGIAWDAAINHIIRLAEKKPVFDPAVVRGPGAWIDRGQLTINTGKNLLINNNQRELWEGAGDYVYERGKSMPYGTVAPARTEDLSVIVDVVSKIDWHYPIYGKLLLGWILLSPFAGALKWRSHIWIVGQSGSGKSWVIENILTPLVGEFGIIGFGTSTPSGIRQSLENSAKCAIIDEMESDNPKYAEYIDQNLKMFREASSAQGASTLHGTADGEGRRWRLQTMVCCSSIGAAIKHGADKSRFTQIRFKTKRCETDASIANFDYIAEQAKKYITPILGRAIISRSIQIWPDITKAIEIMTTQLTQRAGSRRYADQVGTLLAGAWFFENCKPLMAAEAAQYIDHIGVDIITDHRTDKTDQELCLDEILSYRIEISDGVKRSRVTIGASCDYWYKTNSQVGEDEVIFEFPAAEPRAIKHELQQIGIKPICRNNILYLRIAREHPAIKKILRDTPWASMYADMLSRLDCVNKISSCNDRFAGIPKLYIDLVAGAIFEDIPI